jgi:hypothetical protein
MTSQDSQNYILPTTTIEAIATSAPSQHVQIFSNNPWVLFLSLPSDVQTMASHDLTSKIIRTEQYPFACGGYAEVYRAEYIDDSGSMSEVLWKLTSRFLISA